MVIIQVVLININKDNSIIIFNKITATLIFLQLKKEEGLLLKCKNKFLHLIFKAK